MLADTFAAVPECRVLLQQFGVGGRGTVMPQELPQEEGEARDGENEYCLPRKLSR